MKEDFSKKAVAYVRMSTDHQDFSIENQLDFIKEYAQKNGLELIEIFEDAGKSGVKTKDRHSFQRLLKIAENKEAYFGNILVYDMSRWGRFQDPREGIHYIYVCEEAKAKLISCTENFGEEGTIGYYLAQLMQVEGAGKYSKILSDKVFLGAKKLISMGFKQGGFAGFGLRRVLVDASRNRKFILARGEHKSIQTDRIILEPSEDKEEIEIVKWIYSSFLEENLTEKQIAERLNIRGIKSDLGKDWNSSTIHQVLTNEKYIGNIVYNRTSGSFIKHGKLSVKNPESEWLRFENAFEAIIDKETFYKVKAKITNIRKKYTNEKLLDFLKCLYEKNGYLSGIIINECADIPSSAAYANRFGTLLRAYELVGYIPEHDYSYLKINKFIRALHSDVILGIENQINKVGATFRVDAEFDGIRWINEEIKLSLVIARCKKTNSVSKWIFRLERKTIPDFTIILRLNADNCSIKDYYIISKLDIDYIELNFSQKNKSFLDMFRYDDIDWFFEKYASRTQIKRIYG